MNKIYICIYHRPDYDEFKHYFDDIKNVKVVLGNITSYSCECIATAGNSYGMMDGGIDGTINYFLDYCQGQVQSHIEKYYMGECPVGSSFIVPVNNKNYKYLCYTPTMKIPDNVSDSLNAYLSFRSTLVTCINCGIKEVIVPLYCHGVGRMETKEVLRQYKEAITSIFLPTKYNWDSIRANHLRHIGKHQNSKHTVR